MRIEKIKFNNQEGQELSARIYHPLEKKPKFWVLFAHCFTCSQNFKAVSNISNTLCNQGIAVMSFDFTGLGSSEGDFEDTNFSSNVQDLVLAAKFMEDNYEAPSLVIGHSLGGAAAILAANRLDSVKAIVTIGSPADPEHVRHLFEDSAEKISSQGKAKVNIGGRSFTIKQQFMEDLSNQQLTEILSKMRKSILILHSPQDRIVHVDNAAKLYQSAHHPKSFISLDGADHLLTKQEDSAYAADLIASWATRYIPFEKEPHDTLGHQVQVRLSGDRYTSEIKTPDHYLLADEPASVGGDNLGPTPYDLLMASLGACTVMTLKMYADRKKWDMKEVSVYLNYDKVHKLDSENPEEKGSKVNRFTRTLHIEGDLDDQQRQRLLEIANKCPVHRTLHEEIMVETRLG
jgi:uncharacterized OsmC-like protein/alpha-beta hydrolase superfamily lysophospholipase